MKNIQTKNLLVSQLLITSQHFRLSKEVLGSQSFSKCLDMLETIFEEDNNISNIELLLPKMLEAQERQDWLGLADTLEYELVPLL
ncbi:hypothetical protein [Shewanella waksmanii]|uniref:hypothetical protein n=1 Tax=Shewanella waksmanii TaxID=213783 RepID=UPI003736B62B